MRRLSFLLLNAFMFAVEPSAAMSRPLPAPSFGDAATLAQDKFQPVQYRQCSQRVGPFATQTTAWQRWRQARSQGYAVSQGVVPCYGGGRGYCFNVFRPC